MLTKREIELLSLAICYMGARDRALGSNRGIENSEIKEQISFNISDEDIDKARIFISKAESFIQMTEDSLDTGRFNEYCMLYPDEEDFPGDGWPDIF